MTPTQLGRLTPYFTPRPLRQNTSPTNPWGISAAKPVGKENPSPGARVTGASRQAHRS